MMPDLLSPGPILAQALHLLLMLAAAVLLPGFIGLLQARLQRRQGAPAWQPARDWLRLLRKQPVLAEHASPIAALAPYAACGALLVAAMLVPGFLHGMTLSGASDLLLLAGLLALARLAQALAALDAGTAAGGRAAARAMGQASFALPALLLVAMGCFVMAGTTAPDAIGAALQDASVAPRLPLALLLPALAAVAMADAGLLSEPLGIPEASGRHLALWQAEAALRLVVWLALLAGLFLPFGVAEADAGLAGWALSLPLWLCKLVVLAGFLALAGARIARLRDARLLELLGAGALLALLGVAWLFLSAGVA
jgi:formate hydrogenlyase subunit 4